MNYLISTFDGFGDGVIYYPVFREVGNKIPKSEFFYTSNLFFQDNGIRNKINLPPNFSVIGNEFRKFPKKDWENIYDFLEKNDIKVVINLRFIGRKFEKDYYDFKQWVTLKNSNIVFFDNESLLDDEKINVNVRNIILLIIEKAFKIKLSYNLNMLKEVSQPNKQSDSILINIHSRGTFKQWEVNKWAELISSLTLSDKKTKIYEGFGDLEKSYSNRVIENLQQNTRNKIEVISPLSLGELVEYLRNTFLLISIDSGLIHLADAIGIDSLGIYLTTSSRMWGGITDRFHCVESKHMSSCKNFYPYFGMCINSKVKCEEISGEKDDVSTSDVLSKVDQIFYEKKN